MKNFHLGFIAAFCLVCVLAIFSYTKIKAIITSAATINYTKQLTLELEKVSGSLTEAETGQRGYLLTKEKIFLESFRKGLKEYPQRLKSVRQLILDKPEQQKQFAAIEILAQRREAYMHKMLEIGKIRGATVEELLTGKSIMDSLQSVIDTMIASEESKLNDTIKQHNKQNILAPLSLLILCSLALATIYIIYWRLNKSLAQAQALRVEAIQQAVNIESTREIKESETRYNMMLMKSPFCFGVIKGNEMIISFANDAIKEVWGKGTDIEGKPFLEVLPELVDTSFPKLIRDVMTTGVPYYGYDTLAQLTRNGKLEDGYFNFIYQPYYESDSIISGVTIIAIDVTKEVMAKKQVEKGEVRFRKTMEQAPVAICIMRGNNYEVELINEKNLAILGRTKEQVLGKPIFTTVSEGAKQGFEEILHSVFNTGKSYIANEQPLTLFRDGKQESMYLNITYEALYDDDNKIDRIISVAMDVTEQVIVRKKIEESEDELRKLKEQMELSIQAGQIGVWFWDVKNDILTWSKEQRMIYGVGESELINNATQFNELIFPEDLQGIKVDQTEVGELEQEHDFRIKRKNDGQTRWIKSRARKILNENGELEFISGVNIDITEQVVATQKIKESENYFRKLTDNVPAIIWITDPDGSCSYLNKLWYDYTGQTEEFAKGFGWLEATHPDDKERASEIFLKANTAQIPFSILYRLRNANGEYRWAVDSGSPKFNADGMFEGMIGTVVDVHEEKSAEEKLAYRTALLEAHNEANVDGVLLVDVKGKIISYNQKFIEIWNMPQHITEAKDDDAALSFAMTKLVNPQQFMDKVNYLYENPTETSIDELDFKDGRILERNGYPVIGEDGTYYAWSWTFKDITKQKKLERILTESENRYRRLFDSSPIAITEEDHTAFYEKVESLRISGITTDYANYFANHPDELTEMLDKVKILGVNEGLLDLTGSKDLEHFVANRSKFFVITTHTTVFKLMELIHNGGGYFDEETTIKSLSGKLKQVIMRLKYPSAPPYDSIAITMLDVTEQKKFEQKIKENEQRFRTLAQTLPQLVWVTDAQGKAEFASESWKDYSGIEPGDEQVWNAIMHPDDYDNINAAWTHSLTTGNIYTAEVRLKNKEGEYRWHAVRGKSVVDKENTIIKWVGAFTDIHEQKIREEQKDEFISIASHELKTPLTTAKAYLQMLELSIDESNEDASLYVKKASQSVKRLNELIGELLDVSKIRLGKLDYTITIFNFDEMVKNTVENIQLISPTHSIIISGKVEDEVTGDKERLQQVLINLLTNAIKYSPGTDKVLVTVAQEDEMVTVSIKDSGIGMSKESLKKIFDKYHRVEEHALQFQGLGIGLFISAEIIQRHGGKLWAESDIGNGSVFNFNLPVRYVETAP